ncbi:ferrous iron transport protein A [Thermotoga sp.]|uniref:FeoA family protein n=1 Tax=Thermotoga sp. TaxID=28240 RepID=UPI0025F54104|nr:ferrous iron transport protein A [Thermotoga sp.]MCD6552163.1 ferrous iron transport protein A [Thermotoga sp.]
MRLSDLTPGVRARIVSLNFSGDLHEKLVGMGIIPGEEIEIVQIAPLGDPIVCKVGGRSITLRKKEANGIEVETKSNELPLFLANDGVYRVIDLRGGRRFLLRMKALGIERGKTMVVLRGRYSVEGREISLGRGEAMKIWVRRIENVSEEKYTKS